MNFIGGVVFSLLFDIDAEDILSIFQEIVISNILFFCQIH